MKKTRGWGDTVKERRCARHPRVALSPHPSVFFFILHPLRFRERLAVCERKSLLC
jgi:hypothetical protein